MAPPLPTSNPHLHPPPPAPPPSSSSSSSHTHPQVHPQPHLASNAVPPRPQPQRQPTSPSSNTLKRPSIHIQNSHSSHSNGFLKPSVPFFPGINSSTAYISPLTASPVDNGVKRRKFDEYTSNPQPAKTPLTATLITPHSSLSVKPPRLRTTEVTLRQLATPSPTPSPGLLRPDVAQATAVVEGEVIKNVEGEKEDEGEDPILENTSAISVAIEEVEEEVDAEDSALEEELSDEDESATLIAKWPSALLKSVLKDRPILQPKSRMEMSIGSCYGRENWDRETYLALLKSSAGL